MTRNDLGFSTLAVTMHHMDLTSIGQLIRLSINGSHQRNRFPLLLVAVYISRVPCLEIGHFLTWGHQPCSISTHVAANTSTFWRDHCSHRHRMHQCLESDNVDQATINRRLYTHQEAHSTVTRSLCLSIPAKRLPSTHSPLPLIRHISAQLEREKIRKKTHPCFKPS